MTSLFQPPFIIRNAHVQTLFAALPVHDARSLHRIRRVISVPLRDPTTGSLSITATMQRDRNAPGVLLVHGLGGSHRSGYLARTTSILVRNGFHTFALDLRGSGASALTTHGFHHAGLNTDIHDAVDQVLTEPSVTSLSVVGFSLGGHVVLSALSAWGSQVPPRVRAAVAVSAPLDLRATSTWLERRETWPYRTFLMRSLRSIAHTLASRNPARSPLGIPAIAALRTVREFDEGIVVPTHGFADALDYYDRMSAGPRLGTIELPTLLLHADDDPMVPGFTVRPHLRSPPSSLRVLITPHGGHVGFVDQLITRPLVPFMVREMLAFIKTHAS